MPPLKVSNVLEAWKTFDLHDKQKQIDESATQVLAKQDQSELSKKKLIELSKEFKRTTSEETRKLVGPLLKGFQNEVDNLNKRCKFAECAFLGVYKDISDIFDPIPSLEYCMGLEKKVGKNVDLELENKNLRETLKEYNEEFKELRKQEVIMKELKEKLKSYEDNIDETVTIKLKELEDDLLLQFSEKEQLLSDAKNSAMRRLQDVETRLITLQKTLDQTQSELFQQKNKMGDIAAAHRDEINILTVDQERASQRLMLTQKENSNLEEQLSQALDIGAQKSSSNITSDVQQLARLSLETELASKTQETFQLVEDVKGLQAAMREMREEYKNKLSSLESQLDHKSAHLDELQKIVTEQADYQENKRELNIIKSVEFGAEDLSLGHDQYQPQSSKSLEVLLIGKNKQLQNENTVLKQSNVDLSRHVTESNQEVSNLRALSSEQKNLILQLESDVESMQAFSSAYRTEGEGCVSAPELVAEAVKGSMSIDEPSRTSVVEMESLSFRNSSERTSSVSSIQGYEGGQSAAESLLPIVTAQRERFKLKNDELEAESLGRKQQLTTLQNEVDTLRNDNVKLYEKIRFLQSYQGQKGAKRDSSVAETRYSSQYEENLDPFSSFSRTERMRRYGNLSAFEKITLSIGRFILSNKTARTVGLLYTLLVHCLVMLVLYQLVNTAACKREVSSDCAERFSEHMHDVHGFKDFHG